MWGQGTYDSVHALLGLGTHAEGGVCRGQMGKAEVSRGTAEVDPVLGTPGLQGEEPRLDEGRPQKAP